MLVYCFYMTDLDTVEEKNNAYESCIANHSSAKIGWQQYNMVPSASKALGRGPLPPIPSSNPQVYRIGKILAVLEYNL